jgi:UDP-N-acetylglucosamine--dolichyl-phosphate N-acetylglucosaminephosphotransferase
MGLICASVYIILLVVFIPFPFSNSLANLPSHQHGNVIHVGLSLAESLHHQVSSAPMVQYPYAYVLHPQKLSVYLSSLLSLLMATMLGFLDDVFDIRWRHKLPIPIIASIPLLMVYYAEQGNTHVVVPLPLRPIFGTLLNLGE